MFWRFRGSSVQLIGNAHPLLLFLPDLLAGRRRPRTGANKKKQKIIIAGLREQPLLRNASANTLARIPGTLKRTVVQCEARVPVRSADPREEHFTSRFVYITRVRQLTGPHPIVAHLIVDVCYCMYRSRLVRMMTELKLSPLICYG